MKRSLMVAASSGLFAITALASSSDIGLMGPRGKTIRFSYGPGLVQVDICKDYEDLGANLSCSVSEFILIGSTEFVDLVREIAIKKQLVPGMTAADYEKMATTRFSEEDRNELAELERVSRYVSKYEPNDPKQANRLTRIAELAARKAEGDAGETAYRRAFDKGNAYARELLEMIKADEMHIRTATQTEQYESSPTYPVLKEVVNRVHSDSVTSTLARIFQPLPGGSQKIMSCTLVHERSGKDSLVRLYDSEGRVIVFDEYGSILSPTSAGHTGYYSGAHGSFDQKSWSAVLELIENAVEAGRCDH